MKKTIKLLDLDCGHCADKIQNAVKKIDGVTYSIRRGIDAGRQPAHGTAHGCPAGGAAAWRRNSVERPAPDGGSR